MKALFQAGSLSGYLDIVKPDDKLAMRLPYAQNAYTDSLDWSNVDSLIFKLEHISEVGGEKVAVYRYYEPRLAIRNEERLLLLEKENRNHREEIGKLHKEINDLRTKYEPTNDEW